MKSDLPRIAGVLDTAGCPSPTTFFLNFLSWFSGGWAGGPTMSTGVTPRLMGVHMNSEAGIPGLSLVSPVAAEERTPKTPRTDEEGAPLLPHSILRRAKTPRLSGDSDAASGASSRVASMDTSGSRLEAAAAVRAVDAAAARGAGATAEEEEAADGEEEAEESSDEESSSLQRMLQMHRRSTSRAGPSPLAGQPSRQQAAGSPQVVDGGTDGSAAGSAVGEQPEEGWDAPPVRRRSSRRTPEVGADGVAATGSSSRLAGEGVEGSEDGKGASEEPAPATATAAASSAHAGPHGSDSEDDSLYEAYAAAKDSSRRRIGKHSRSKLQAVQRQYSIEARQAQRSGLPPPARAK